MEKFDAVIVASGKSERAGIDKLSFGIGKNSIISRTIDAFFDMEDINKIIVVTDLDIEINEKIIVVKGGSTRGESVRNGLEKVNSKYVLIHDGARPFASSDLIKRVMVCAIKHNSAIPCVKNADSLRKIQDNIIEGIASREEILCVQTPQGFLTSEIKKAYSMCNAYLNSDESEIYATFIGKPHTVEGELSNKKITYYEDLLNLNCRVGIGFDFHEFEEDKPLFLGGVLIPYKFGLKAHSDGDAIIHAVMDALLSAAGLRDIGMQFPDSDENYKGADSKNLLLKVKGMLKEQKIEIISIAITVMAQKPRLSEHIPKMKDSITKILETSPRKVSINATTTENLGITAEGKGIAALAIASVI